MASKSKFQAIRGTRDLLPPDTALWNRVEQTAHEVFATFGFGEIRPPEMEDLQLFFRAIGFDTDIVGKEMFVLNEFYENRTQFDLDGQRTEIQFMPVTTAEDETLTKFRDSIIKFTSNYKEAAEKGLVLANNFTDSRIRFLDGYIKEFDRLMRVDRSGPWQELVDDRIEGLKHLTMSLPLTLLAALRPEATAGVCRAYIEHSMQQLPQPVKLFYMGPMFRRERPQKGRYRQFYQIGAEILGGPDAPAIDAELIEMLMTFFDKCGLQGTELSINSIGHAANNCRRGYVAKLKADLEKVKDKLGADSQRRIETNPLRVLDSKLEHEQPIIEKLPRIADHLCDECKAHYAAVKHELELRGVIYRENWRLVRGLDYYMRTTFEITALGLGSQNAVCGGGRYDGLVELLGGPPTKGIGFAIGEDRLILSLQESGKAPAAQGRDVYIAWMGQNAYATAIRAAKTLRNAGFRVEMPPTELKFGKALERASKLGSRFALILGEDEITSGQWTLKTLADGSQQKLTEQALLEYLRKQ
jgi:histidyl-tRNA synthetase